MLKESLEKCYEAKNSVLYDAFLKTDAKIKSFKNISVGVSGGADSDVMLDLIWRCDKDKKARYVFFDTGIEYQATKEHLDFLEKKYDIKIERIRPEIPVPLSVTQKGLPFFSKFVSQCIEYLQRVNFKFEDKPYEELLSEYPKISLKALKWWCNRNNDYEHIEPERSRYNIAHISYLKDFLVSNPPTFLISDKCCADAKKNPIKIFVKDNGVDLNVLGVRKSEGGIRSMAYKSCFSEATDRSVAQYRPLWFFEDKDKLVYEQLFDVTHSRCYTEYGFKRTGCALCPFGKSLDEEALQLSQNEPKLYKACINIFGESIEYTKQFYEFRKQQKALKKEQQNGR